MSQISKETSLEGPFSWGTRSRLLQAEVHTRGGTAAGLLSAFSTMATMRALATAGLSGTLPSNPERGQIHTGAPCLQWWLSFS